MFAPSTFSSTMTVPSKNCSDSAALSTRSSFGGRSMGQTRCGVRGNLMNPSHMRDKFVVPLLLQFHFTGKIEVNTALSQHVSPTPPLAIAGLNDFRSLTDARLPPLQ